MASGAPCYPPSGLAPQSEFKSDSSPVPILVHNAPPHAMPGFSRTASPIEQVVTCRSAIDTPCSRALSGWPACRDDSPCVPCSPMCMRSSSSSSGPVGNAHRVCMCALRPPFRCSRSSCCPRSLLTSRCSRTVTSACPRCSGPPQLRPVSRAWSLVASRRSSSRCEDR
jgi:hypothetical protein